LVNVCMRYIRPPSIRLHCPEPCRAPCPPGLRWTSCAPENTEPVGKAGMQPQGETDQVNTNKLRIPTLWGKNADPPGKGELLDQPQHAVRWRRWWDRYRLTAVFRGKYARCGVVYRLPTLWGKNTDPWGGLLPIPWGKNTDPWGGLLPIPWGKNTDPPG
jgi:hypothetical protein